MYAPCDPSTRSCLTRQLSIAASQCHAAAAADPAVLPTPHWSEVDRHFYNSTTTSATTSCIMKQDNEKYYFYTN